MSFSPLDFNTPPTPRTWSYWCAECLKRTDTGMVIARKCANCGSLSKLCTTEEEARKWNTELVACRQRWDIR